MDQERYLPGCRLKYGSGLDSILISSAGTYRFTLTDPANAANTCFGEVTVNQDTARPDVTIAPCGTLTCLTTSLQLMAHSSTPGVTFSWTGPNGFSSSLEMPTITVAG